MYPKKDEMVKFDLRINKEKLEEWLKCAGMTQEGFAQDISEDPGNFSKMLNGKISTSKNVIEKVLGRTMLPHAVILLPVINKE